MTIKWLTKKWQKNDNTNPKWQTQMQKKCNKNAKKWQNNYFGISNVCRPKIFLTLSWSIHHLPSINWICSLLGVQVAMVFPSCFPRCVGAPLWRQGMSSREMVGGLWCQPMRGLSRRAGEPEHRSCWAALSGCAYSHYRKMAQLTVNIFHIYHVYYIYYI